MSSQSGNTAPLSAAGILKKRKRRKAGKSSDPRKRTVDEHSAPSPISSAKSNKRFVFDGDGIVSNITDPSTVELSETTPVIPAIQNQSPRLEIEESSHRTGAEGIQPETNEGALDDLPARAGLVKNTGESKIKKRATHASFYSDDEDEDDDNDFDSGSFSFSKNANKTQLLQRANALYEIRKTLPIFQHKDEIVDYISQNQVTVIIGETGSGKSTQIPQFLMPINKKQIAVTQPRRVAAASLASRVSEEYGCVLGEEVGYQVRFSNVTDSRRTKLKYLTDGMLLRELMIDQKLSKYSTVILDEAHERTILTDLIMGFLKQLVVSGRRPDLKVIIMSATLNAELFSTFFGGAPILFVEGKMFPVLQHYLTDSAEAIVDVMVRTVVQLNRSETIGDVLCFLPGQEEIDNCVNILNQLAPALPKDAPLMVPLPLYAALSPAQQGKIFEPLPKRRRKIILATNIAETSITVPGVKYVVDSGLRKVKVWKHQLGLSSLLTTPISQASAKQRAGRAGRESEGKVFRLYLENVYRERLPQQQESEIMRNDITLPVLTLKRMGVHDLLNWTWLEHPGQNSILSALKTLYSLGALGEAGKITPLGLKMAVLPLPPQLSAVLISAMDFKVLGPVIDIVACLSVDNLILNGGRENDELRDELNFRRRQYCSQGCRFGDLIALKEYFDYFQEILASVPEAKNWCKEMQFSYKGFKNVLKVRQQLKDYMITTIKQDDSIDSETKSRAIRDVHVQLNAANPAEAETDFEGPSEKHTLDIPAILKSFLKGYITNTAVGMPDRSYRTFSTGQLISIHPSSNLFGKANLDGIMYIEYVYTSKGYGRTCSLIELSWLQEVAPQILGTAKISVAE